MKQPQRFILLLGSGVVSYWIHKIHFSTCSLFPVGVGTSEVSTQTMGTSDTC